MKRILKYFITLLVLVVLVDVWSNASAQQLELQISLKDTTYLMCEPIWLDAEITNISKDTVRIWGLHFPGGGHLNVILTDEQGDTLRLRYLDNYRDLSGFILNPGETHFEALALAEIFWNYDVPSVSRHSLRFTSLAPGSYQVNAQYRRRYDSDRIDTSPLHFRVVEPTGAEREALDLLLEIYKNWMSSNHEKVSQLLNNLTANYPKSAYLERAYLRVGKKEELLEKLPDTGYLNGYLNTVVEKISDEKEKREFLENIIRKHPGTRTARYAEQELRRLQRGE